MSLHKIIPLKRGQKLYFDLPATRETWKLNQDLIFYEDERVYVNGTIASDRSTVVLRRELLAISKHL